MYYVRRGSRRLQSRMACKSKGETGRRIHPIINHPDTTDLEKQQCHAAHRSKASHSVHPVIPTRTVQVVHTRHSNGYDPSRFRCLINMNIYVVVHPKTAPGFFRDTGSLPMIPSNSLHQPEQLTAKERSPRARSASP